MDTEHKLSFIRNAIVKPKLYNVEISYLDDKELPKGKYLPVQTKSEFFWGLTLEQCNQLSLLLAAHHLDCTLKIREVI